jgi:membrane protein DedA with SNARE-associated domain
MMESLGYVDVVLLMVLENIIPPIPSEVVLPAAGAKARHSSHWLMGMIAAGTIGSIIGAMPWYLVARRIGTDRFLGWIDRYGHWFGTNRHELQRADEWFDRYGHWAVLLGRLVPGVRTIISVPAGFSEMPMRSFMTYTAIGTALWTTFLAAIGYWLQGQYEQVASVVKWIGGIVVVLMVGWFVVRVAVATVRKQKRSSEDSSR